MSKLLVIGTVAFDAIETPFGKTPKILGGAGTYIGLSASNFKNVDTGLVSVVGEDFPQEYFDILHHKNIDTTGIEIVKDGKTFFWSGKYHDNMNKRDTLITELNVLEHFNPVVPEKYRDSEIVMLGNLHPLVQHAGLEQMLNKPKMVVLDTMDFWMDIALDDLKMLLKKVDVITINDEEAQQLSGEYSLVKAAAVIHELGPEYVVIKKGEHGALLFHKDNMFFAPALPLADVFDPTGAGDTFAGGFTGYLAQQDEITFEKIKNAVIWGSNLASFTVEEFGVKRIAEVSYEEVEERLEKFKELTKFSL
ncbi:MAG: PfkB family carbohydrate kinase [Wenyingzhuangia sp.]|jgi:sugar/nucleoside kinase (ribokinase family)|uniref:PfkB family carbohydrate kinase n=1 Tax=Wenyingzhuangia sp. TaxID=1964193 RepID=UPI00321BABA9